MERRNLPTVRHLESETAGHLLVLPSRETRARGLLQTDPHTKERRSRPAVEYSANIFDFFKISFFLNLVSFLGFNK